MKISLDFSERINKVKRDLIHTITSAVLDNEGFVAFPTSDEEEEDKVRIDAHVDMSGQTEPCTIGSVAINHNGKTEVNMSDRFFGHWTLEVTELSIESLFSIVEYLDKNGYVK